MYLEFDKGRTGVVERTSRSSIGCNRGNLDGRTDAVERDSFGIIAAITTIKTGTEYFN